MSIIDHCLERLALLDHADRLLSEVRVYNHHAPHHRSMSERLAQHRLLLGEARRHLDSARLVGQNG